MHFPRPKVPHLLLQQNHNPFKNFTRSLHWVRTLKRAVLGVQFLTPTSC
jgi:hypothetical protein